MNQIDFDALMVKLSLATWVASNLTSNTKIFSTVINGVPVKLYELANITDSEDNRPNLYIDGVAPHLTEGQLTTLNIFGETLLSDFSTEIQDALNAQVQQLEDDVQTIIS